MENRALPENWARCRVTELAQLIRGVTYKKSEASKESQPGFAPLLRANNINGRINHEDLVYVREARISNEQWLKESDVLIAMSSGSIGLVGKAAQLRKVKGETFGSFCGALRPTSEIDCHFFGWFFQTRTYRECVSGDAKGSNINNLKRDHILHVDFPLPPANEQRRIVEKIETLFSRLDKGEEALRDVQKLLSRYRQSVLKAAVTGQLTADWRAENAHRLEHGRDLLARILQTRRESWEGRGKYKEPIAPSTSGLPDLPDGWVWASLAQLTHIKGGVTVDKKRESKNPVTVPYLRVANVQNGHIDLTEIKEITVNRDKAEQTLLKAGDILLNEGGDRDKLGRGWVWDGQIAPCIHQNHVFRARPVIPEISSRFVSYYANAFGQGFFMQKGKQSVNLASISLTAISGFPIALPSADEQREIVGRLEEKLIEVATVAEWCKTELTRSAALRQSILKDAFTGRLVPQNPSDEPAAELLARIRAARQAAPKGKTRRKATA
ncbi:restriction endonuclease subunit S [Nitrococcus mobilis]|uniref:Type I restriction enzyme StySPI specificity protein n=1 Tax=Nitrococcus mobilis Nb-231 TaxID=314278 RepID=A4BLE7_9GAMM|nr:restriction endonuclease subunit S [Nitrococcus mobilis]EAR23135.1 Type I restriction enzyme StySPI specificity protein [Nitrococcus mobilis Nb-231]